MNKIKNFIREVVSLERITVCLVVFTVFILVPLYIISIIVQVIKLGFIKLIISGTCIAILAFGVLLSLIYTIGSRIYNYYKYKDEYFYEDIDYEDEDKDK